MYITQFGGYTLPEQLELSENESVARRPSSQVLGGAGGVVDLNGTGPDPLAVDQIAKSFWLDASSDTALRTSLDSLKAGLMLSDTDWRQGTRPLFATMPDGSQRLTWAKCINIQIQWQYFNVNRGWVPVQVTFERKWPKWLTATDLRFFGDHLGTFAEAEAANWDFDGGGGGGVTSESVSSSPHTFTITNGGNARILWGQIEFNGQVTNPKLENLTNGHWFQYSGALASGGRLTVEPHKFRAQVDGVSAWPSLTVGSGRGQLVPMALEPGANSMRITGTGISGLTFTFYWADTWF